MYGAFQGRHNEGDNFLSDQVLNDESSSFSRTNVRYLVYFLVVISQADNFGAAQRRRRGHLAYERHHSQETES